MSSNENIIDLRELWTNTDLDSHIFSDDDEWEDDCWCCVGGFSK